MRARSIAYGIRRGGLSSRSRDQLEPRINCIVDGSLRLLATVCSYDRL